MTILDQNPSSVHSSTYFISVFKILDQENKQLLRFLVSPEPHIFAVFRPLTIQFFTKRPGVKKK